MVEEYRGSGGGKKGVRRSGKDQNRVTDTQGVLYKISPEGSKKEIKVGLNRNLCCFKGFILAFSAFSGDCPYFF